MKFITENLIDLQSCWLSGQLTSEDVVRSLFEQLNNDSAFRLNGYGMHYFKTEKNLHRILEMMRAEQMHGLVEMITRQFIKYFAYCASAQPVLNGVEICIQTDLGVSTVRLMCDAFSIEEIVNSCAGKRPTDIEYMAKACDLYPVTTSVFDPVTAETRRASPGAHTH